ncbi:MAG TPA: metallophosphoesterase family protein [Acidobacteriota bacterium]|nr:metallophosphoesterase family protein [Acidobacteriota bacterium]HNT18600.1 metallophosphoesterase family protein [Acidobacteriota bacterium]
MSILLSAPLLAAGQDLVRQPYLQRLTPSSVTIAFKSDVPAVGAVEYGITDSLGSTVVEASASILHGIELSGLQQNSIYFYRVTLDGTPATDIVSFRTARDASVPIFSFNAVGDLGCGDAPPPTFACAAVAQKWTESASDFGIFLGDNVYDTGADNDYDPKLFSNYWQFWRTRCIYPAIGNHDTYTDNGLPFDNNFFNFSNNGESSERYYSFRYGNALFIALDPVSTAYGPSDPQTLWLIGQLQNSADLWNFAYFHYPPYSCCAGHGSDLAVREAWSPVFEQYGVDMAFTAHDHGYERTFPVRDYFPSSRGVVYYISGGGGYWNYEWNTDCPWTAHGERTYEFLRVEVLGARLRTCGMKPDGTVFDCASYLKSDMPFDLYRGTDPSSLVLCQAGTILDCSVTDGVPPENVVFFYRMDGPIVLGIDKNEDGTNTLISHRQFE